MIHEAFMSYYMLSAAIGDYMLFAQLPWDKLHVLQPGSETESAVDLGGANGRKSDETAWKGVRGLILTRKTCRVRSRVQVYIYSYYITPHHCVSEW